MFTCSAEHAREWLHVGSREGERDTQREREREREREKERERKRHTKIEMVKERGTR